MNHVALLWAILLLRFRHTCAGFNYFEARTMFVPLWYAITIFISETVTSFREDSLQSTVITPQLFLSWLFTAAGEIHRSNIMNTRSCVRIHVVESMRDMHLSCAQNNILSHKLQNERIEFHKKPRLNILPVSFNYVPELSSWTLNKGLIVTSF